MTKSVALCDVTGLSLEQGTADLWMVPLDTSTSSSLLLGPKFVNLGLAAPQFFEQFVDASVLHAMGEEQVETATKLLPFKTPGDHNCLCHGAAIALWGSQDKDFTLRKAIARNMEGDTEPAQYFQEQWVRMMLDRDHRSFGMEIERSNEEWAREWEEELRLVQDSDKSLTEIHILILAHVIRRPIIVYSGGYCKDVDGQALAPVYFGGVYLPTLLLPSDCASRHPLLLAYAQSHFTALVPLEPEHEPPVAPLHDGEGRYLPIQFASSPPGSAPWRELLQKYMHLEEGPPLGVLLGGPRCPVETILLRQCSEAAEASMQSSGSLQTIEVTVRDGPGDGPNRIPYFPSPLSPKPSKGQGVFPCGPSSSPTLGFATMRTPSPAAFAATGSSVPLGKGSNTPQSLPSPPPLQRPHRSATPQLARLPSMSVGSGRSQSRPLELDLPWASSASPASPSFRMAASPTGLRLSTRQNCDLQPTTSPTSTSPITVRPNDAPQRIGSATGTSHSPKGSGRLLSAPDAAFPMRQPPAARQGPETPVRPTSLTLTPSPSPTVARPRSPGYGQLSPKARSRSPATAQDFHQINVALADPSYNGDFQRPMTTSDLSVSPSGDDLDRISSNRRVTCLRSVSPAVHASSPPRQSTGSQVRSSSKPTTPILPTTAAPYSNINATPQSPPRRTVLY